MSKSKEEKKKKKKKKKRNLQFSYENWDVEVSTLLS